MQGWERAITPYQTKDSSPTIQTYRMKDEKLKPVEEKKWASSSANKWALPQLLKQASPIPSYTGSGRAPLEVVHRSSTARPIYKWKLYTPTLLNALWLAKNFLQTSI